MKRNADGKPKAGGQQSKNKKIDSFMEAGKKKDALSGVWSAEGEDDLLIFTPNECVPQKKVACFDMDGTLITTKSGKVFPVNTDDWKLIFDSVPKRVKELVGDGFKVVIFTNQKGLKVGKVDKKDFKRKIEAVVGKIGVPIQVFVAVSRGAYRKPCVGMWDALVQNNAGVDIDKASSFYVGDAAGRHKTSVHLKKDHSCADRYFAANVGLRFETPEYFFNGLTTHEPWGPPTFEPRNLLASKSDELVPASTKFPFDSKEIIVMVGFPGSGKSTFSRRIAQEHDYSIVSRDKLGSWQKCVAAAKYALNEGKSVVVDNTNPDRESRKRYTDVAKELGVNCRCFKMECDFNQAQHILRFRTLTSKDAQDISTMVLRMHNSKFQEPDLTEGFTEIVTVNFVPQFDSDEHKDLFAMYLTES